MCTHFDEAAATGELKPEPLRIFEGWSIFRNTVEHPRIGFLVSPENRALIWFGVLSH